MELIQHNTTNNPPATLQIALERAEQETQTLHKFIAQLRIEYIDDIEALRRTLENEINNAERNLSFCTNKDPMKYLDEIQILETWKDHAIKRMSELPRFPRLASLRKADEAKTTDDVMLLLCWLQEQLNVTHNLSNTQIEMCAIDIVQGYGAFRLEDIAACFKYGLRGAYGKIFERLDANVIHSWLRAYQQQRIESREQHSINQHLSTKESAHRTRKDTPTPTQVKETFNLLYPNNHKPF